MILSSSESHSQSTNLRLMNMQVSNILIRPSYEVQGAEFTYGGTLLVLYWTAHLEAELV
jgi:hypothetical protein